MPLLDEIGYKHFEEVLSSSHSLLCNYELAEVDVSHIDIGTATISMGHRDDSVAGADGDEDADVNVDSNGFVMEKGSSDHHTLHILVPKSNKWMGTSTSDQHNEKQKSTSKAHKQLVHHD